MFVHEQQERTYRGIITGEFTKRFGVKVENRPNAPRAFRPDLTIPVVEGEGLKWGIGMVHNGDEAYLIRFELERKRF